MITTVMVMIMTGGDGDDNYDSGGDDDDDDDTDSDKLQGVLALPKPVICCFAALITYLTDFNLHSVLRLTR